MRQVYESGYGATSKINYLKEEEGGGGAGQRTRRGRGEVEEGRGNREDQQHRGR